MRGKKNREERRPGEALEHFENESKKKNGLNLEGRAVVRGNGGQSVLSLENQRRNFPEQELMNSGKIMALQCGKEKVPDGFHSNDD